MADNVGPVPARKSKKKKKPRSEMGMLWQSAPTDGWTPASREGHVAHVVDGVLYVFGGIANGRRENSTVCLDLRCSSSSSSSSSSGGGGGGSSGGGGGGEEHEGGGRRWRVLEACGDLPAPRAYMGTWRDGPLIFVHGGEGTPAPHAALHATQARNQAALAQRKRQQAGKSGTTAAPDSLKLCYDDLFVLDTRTATWAAVPTKLAPLPRAGHTVAMARVKGVERIALFGGTGPGHLHRLDVFTMKRSDLLLGRAIWTKLATHGQAPLPRQGHTCTSTLAPAAEAAETAEAAEAASAAAGVPPGGSATSMVAGGADAGGAAAHSPHGAQHGGQHRQLLFIFGGKTEGGVLLDDLHQFDAEGAEWSMPAVRGKPPSARHGHAALLVSRRAATEGASAAAAAAAHASLLVYGGMSQTRGQLHFPEAVHVCGLADFCWSEVRVGYDLPTPRYGHSLVAVHSAGAALSVGTAPEAGGGGDGSGAAAAVRSPDEAQGVAVAPCARDGPLAGSEIVVFGGLNDRYCTSDLWCLDSRLRRHVLGRKPKPPLAAGGAAVSLSALEMARVGAEIDEARRDAQMMEKQLVAERVRRAEVEAARAALQELQERTARELAAARAASSNESFELRAALEEQKRNTDRINGAYQETCAVLGLVDMASTLRVSVWKQRAEEAAATAQLDTDAIPTSADSADEIAAQMRQQATQHRAACFTLAQSIEDLRFETRAQRSFR